MSRRPGARRWWKERQHVPGIRQALDLGQRAYEILRGLRKDAEVPAAAGGWPARLVPLPPPRPYGRRERHEIARAMRAQNTSATDGDAVQRFERALAERWGCRHAVAVSSGSGALHAALIASGVGPGDEVIVPALAHESAPLAVLLLGAAPRFADAHPDDWNLDVSRVEALVTERTRAIVVVHLCGVPCDMDAVRALAARRRLRVVEDAAHAHGAAFGGRWVGTIGDLGCLSFQGDKPLTTGEGGAVLTDDDELARRVRAAMDPGETEPGQAALGWNHRMGALPAALGLGQIARLDRMLAARTRNATRLWEQLAGWPGIRRQAAPSKATPSYPNLFVELPFDGSGPSRDELVAGLALERVDCRLPYAQPLSSHPIFGVAGAFPVAERICARGIGFRVDPSLSRRDIDSVAFAVRRLLQWSRPRPG